VNEERSTDILSPLLGLLPGPLRGLLQRSPRATQLARDLAMVASGVLGPPRPVARVHRAVEGAVLPGERRLRVLSVRQETAEAVTLVIERPGGVSYEAGQFLTLVLPLEGGELRRSYSLSSTPLDGGPFEITIKRVAGGAASGWLHQAMRAGVTLRVRGPSGAFVYRPAEAPGRLVLVGGGSGITPLMGILRTALAATPQVPVFLLYANRSPADVIFREELSRLAAAHPQLAVKHVLEEPGEGLPCRQGRVERADLEEALGGAEGAQVYLCGPAPMMDAAVADLRALGLPAGALHLERFVTVRPRVVEGGGLHQLRVGARRAEVPPGKTLLESATAAGIDLDFSCTMGGCGACKARLVEGEVDLDAPNCLSDEERAAGLVLTCVARAKSDVVIERLQ